MQEAGSETLKQVRGKTGFGQDFKVQYLSDAGALPKGGLLTSTISLCGQRVTLVNIHLESPDILFWRVKGTRGKQIEKLKALVAEQDAAIIADDWNLVFDDADKTFPSNWSDAWLTTYPDHTGLNYHAHTVKFLCKNCMTQFP